MLESPSNNGENQKMIKYYRYDKLGQKLLCQN